jgi:uncharacterized protein YecT (DUF1311 family)
MGLIFLLPLSAAAQRAGDVAIGLRSSYEGCTDHKDNEATPALFKCTAVEYEYQDDRLNQVYKRLMISLDAARKKQLQQEERAWLAMRKTYCYSRSSRNQIALLKARNCDVYETAKRATELEYFERHITKNNS